MLGHWSGYQQREISRKKRGGKKGNSKKAQKEARRYIRANMLNEYGVLFQSD